MQLLSLARAALGANRGKRREDLERIDLLLTSISVKPDICKVCSVSQLFDTGGAGGENASTRIS